MATMLSSYTGRVLFRQRQARKLSLGEVADLMGLDSDGVMRLELGELLTFERLELYCTLVLGVSVSSVVAVAERWMVEDGFKVPRNV